MNDKIKVICLQINL